MSNWVNKTILAAIVAAVVLLGGYFIFRGSYQPAPTSQSQTNIQPSQPQSEPVPVSNGQLPPAPAISAVVYTDGGYSPAILKIKVGTTVTFQNQSSRPMWTASAVHPTHRVYPTTGGCLGSTFDACKGIQPGGTWSFKFDFPGTWKYHNHLNPSDTGTIVIE